MSKTLKPIVHTCDIRHAHGNRLRIVAALRSRTETRCDYDVLFLQQVAPGTEVRVLYDGELLGFPRAMGPDGIFELFLSKVVFTDEPAYDEHGVEVPMPGRTPEQWRRDGEMAMAHAKKCFEYAGGGE